MNNRNEIGKGISIRNGEIFLTKRINGEDSMLIGSHYVLILMNQIGCIRSPNATIIPLTSKAKSQPTHVEIPANNETGLIHSSISQAESITTLSKKLLSYRVGFINELLLSKVQHSLLVHTGILKTIDKSYINQLCEQVSGDINLLENEVVADSLRKLTLNSMRVHVESLKNYSEMFLMNWQSMLLSNLKKNGIKYDLQEIGQIFDIEQFRQ